MKIDALDYFYLSMPEILDIGDGSQDTLLVRLEAGGHVGWGECEASPLVTLAAMGLFFVLKGVMPLKTVIRESVDGIRAMQAMVLILLFAFAIGQVTGEMKTGVYLASYADAVLSPVWLAAVIFLLSAVMSFSTGTSWGTFSIMVPIAVPLAVGMDADIALVLGAVISGGVFGDHCSPISDTTIITSMATGCDHVEHVKTQLPYALISGAIAFALFALFGMLR